MSFNRLYPVIQSFPPAPSTGVRCELMAFALSVAAIVTSVIAALSAIACYFVSRAATRRHSIASMRAELDEIHDAMTRHSALLKKINSREVMRERREKIADDSDSFPEAQRPGESGAAWKARMRAKLVIPGRAAPHK